VSVDVEWRSLQAADGHRWQALVARGTRVDRRLVWLPALGVPARTYEPLARAFASRGVAVVVHEWRGLGSSSLRASRTADWGYRELLRDDLPATLAIARETLASVDVLGGHSLGGQLACCLQALASPARRLWLVASGAPFWRAFPSPVRYGLPLAYRSLDALARAMGALPGRRIGFGGNEARSVIRDWARTGLSGHYAAAGIGDMDAPLRAVDVPVHGVLMARDWLAPRSSLDYLVGRMSPTATRVDVLDSAALGTRDDHFAWMKTPAAVVERLLSG